MSQQDVQAMYTALAAPFPAAEIKWRPGSTTRDKSKALALPFINSRAIMQRLDTVLGPANWQDKYVDTSDGVICELSLRINGEWITKSDGANKSDIEPVKGAISDALKRAAVKFGIGRYLYYLDPIWHPLKDGKYLDGTPKLPKSALPVEEGGTGNKVTQAVTATANANAGGKSASAKSESAGKSDKPADKAKSADADTAKAGAADTSAADSKTVTADDLEANELAFINKVLDKVRGGSKKSDARDFFQTDKFTDTGRAYALAELEKIDNSPV